MDSINAHIARLVIGLGVAAFADLRSLGLGLFKVASVPGVGRRLSQVVQMPDHVHTIISIPPKYAVSQLVGFIKGKSAIHIARIYAGRQRNCVGQHF